ncbi:MAG: hypothetical protein ACLR9S_00175 [Lachnospiraceae bacterium]
MFDDEIYDPVLEELRGISASMKELEKLLLQQISIENANNVLLRKLVQRNFENSGKTMINLDFNQFSNKNILIINSSKEESLEIAKKISAETPGKFVVSEAKTDSEFAAMINNLSDGDIIFVDVSDPIFDKKMGKIIYDCVKERCIYVPIGKGSGSRVLQLEVPEIYFIVYSYLEDLIPCGLKELLVLVE